MDWKINGTTFADRELSNVSRELANMATDRLTFEAPGLSITALTLFSYDQAVTVTRDGKPFFSGRCGRVPVHGDPKQEGHSYDILGPWDQLERLVYMQRWKSGHWEDDKFVTEWEYKSRCVLGQDEEGKAIPVGTIISNVIDYAIECGIPIGKGEIAEGPYVPWDEVTDMSCGDVIRRLARWIPDAVGHFDYSKGVPIFNFIERKSLAPVTLSIGAEIESVNLTAVGSRSVPAVVLIYEQSNDIEGATMLSTIKDVYPVNATGREIGAIVQTINLPGWSSSSTVQTQAIHSAVIPTFGENNIPYLEWFLKHHPEWSTPADPKSFNILKFRNVTITSVTRTSTLKLELIEGTLQDWMRRYILDDDGNRKANPHNKYSYQDEEDNVRTTISYQLINAQGYVIREVNNEVITTKILATDCPTKIYRNISPTVAPGDEAIKGLAQYIYETLNATHFKGSVSIAEEEVTGTVGLGNKILISGGKPEWSTMSAVIQSIQSNLDSGSTVIQVGPPNHLSANDMIELRRANRGRKNCLDAAARITGQSTSNTVDLGSALPKGWGASSPGEWGGFIDLVSAVSSVDSSLQIQKTNVHVNMIGASSVEAIDLTALVQNIINSIIENTWTSVDVITAERFYNDKLEVKTRTLKVFSADPESDWITITTALPCS